MKASYWPSRGFYREQDIAESVYQSRESRAVARLWLLV